MVGEGGYVGDLDLVSINVSCGWNTGGLCGWLEGGTISNCSVSGSVSGVSPVGGH